MRSAIVSTLGLISVAPMGSIVAIAAGNNGNGALALSATGVGFLTAVTAVVTATTRARPLMLPAAIGTPVAVLFGAWLFAASWKVGTGFGQLPHCAALGITGSWVYDRVIFPTGLWCASADGADRVLITPIGDSIIYSSLGATLVAASIGITLWSVMRVRRPLMDST